MLIASYIVFNMTHLVIGPALRFQPICDCAPYAFNLMDLAARAADPKRSCSTISLPQKAFQLTRVTLYEDNPTFNKGLLCPDLFEVRGLFEYPFRERTEVSYEEDVDVESMMALASRPSLSL